LQDALDAEGSAPAAALLRARVLEAPRLTGKSMLSAGTLTAKRHTGAADINKFYGTTGPNYLRETR
ncbi:MAG: IucA/IucC family protein, partial [Trebonia sp.]